MLEDINSIESEQFVINQHRQSKRILLLINTSMRKGANISI